MSRAPIVASVSDPDGRVIVLDQEGWQHVLDHHREMIGHQQAILATVIQPDIQRRDPHPGRWRYYRQGIGPSRWCLVIVDCTQEPARVVTAFGTRRDLQGWRQA